MRKHFNNELMSSDKQATRAMESSARWLRPVLFTELPVWQLLLIASAVGVLWAATLFDWSFVTGRHAFWQFPKGTVGGSGADMAQVLIGYLYYVQSPWQLPLFHVPAIDPPVGTNVISLDVVPIIALIGKLVHGLTGAIINLYGPYLFLCFALPGVMMALVLIAARIRYAFAATIAAVFANTMPALLWQWGHVAHESHYLIIGALALYLFSLRRRAWRGIAASWIGVLSLASLTNMYLFAMVGTVWLCSVVQRRLNGLVTTRETLEAAALMVALVTIVMMVSGHFDGVNGLPASRGYGDFSMNLLSPIVPQDSGLFPGAGGVIDATGGQYEGFNYFGMGLLFASLLVLPAEMVWLRRNLCRHVALLVAFAALTAFAISHRVFAGDRLLFELPMPLYVLGALGIFRGSGRFFWLIGYAQMAIVIVLGFRRAQPVMVLCLIAAAILQLFDVKLLRDQIIASIAARPEAGELNRDQVAGLIARARHVEVVPSFQCNMNRDEKWEKIGRANMELMLETARMNVPTNTVYVARQRYGLTLLDLMRAPSRATELKTARREDYCNQEVEQARRGGRPGDVIVLLSDRPRTEEMAPDVICSAISWARYCERSRQ
jgi:hypothetical protein